MIENLLQKHIKNTFFGNGSLNKTKKLANWKMPET